MTEILEAGRWISSRANRLSAVLSRACFKTSCAAKSRLLRRCAPRNGEVKRFCAQAWWRQHLIVRTPSLRATEGSAAISVFAHGCRNGVLKRFLHISDHVGARGCMAYNRKSAVSIRADRIARDSAAPTAKVLGR